MDAKDEAWTTATDEAWTAWTAKGHAWPTATDEAWTAWMGIKCGAQSTDCSTQDMGGAQQRGSSFSRVPEEHHNLYSPYTIP